MSSFCLSSCDANEDTPSLMEITDRSQLHHFVEDISLINTPNDYGWTPLYRAIISSDLQATEELLKQGADPNQVNQMGETPLYQAVEMEMIDTTQLLLRFNADPNITKNDGMSPLSCAVKKTNLPLIKLLLDSKGQPNMQNRLHRQTALHIALKTNAPFEIIKLLIENKSSLTIKDKYDKTPLDYADLANERLMLYLNETIQRYTSSSPIKKAYSTPISSETSRCDGLKKGSASNFSISSKEDNSSNTYHENNVFTLENGLASFYTSKTKRQFSTKEVISDINPVELIITTSNNSHIFSEMQENNSTQRQLTNNSHNESNKKSIIELDSLSSSSKQEEGSAKMVNPLPKKSEMSIDMELEKYSHSNSTPISIRAKKKTYNNAKANSVKISYHRNSNKENVDVSNMHKEDHSTELFHMSNDKQREQSSDNNSNGNVVLNRNTNRLSMNSTRMGTVSQPIGLNTYKDIKLGEENSAAYNKYTFTQVKQLHDWLTSIDLLCYFNAFINRGLYEIQPLIQQMKSGEINLTYRDIEELGMKKPGHIFRFILKAQCDAGQFEPKLINHLFKNSLYGVHLQSPQGVNASDDLLRLSSDSTVCCCLDLIKGHHKPTEDNLTTWLKSKGLSHLQENFTHNGFDLLEYIHLQLFSPFSFTEENLIDYLHIYNECDRQKLLREFQQEAQSISGEVGVAYLNSTESPIKTIPSCQLCAIF